LSLSFVWRFILALVQFFCCVGIFSVLISSRVSVQLLFQVLIEMITRNNKDLMWIAVRSDNSPFCFNWTWNSKGLLLLFSLSPLKAHYHTYHNYICLYIFLNSQIGISISLSLSSWQIVTGWGDSEIYESIWCCTWTALRTIGLWNYFCSQVFFIQLTSRFWDWDDY
jgi:hypothetical protein